MFKLMGRLRSMREEKESGAADVISFLFVFPLLFFMVLSIIEFGLHLQVRSQIQSVARDGARLTAMYGGSAKGVRLNNINKSVDTYMMDRMWNSNGCKLSLCKKKPTVSKCTPTSSKQFGTEVKCTITYFYKPYISGLFTFGLEGITSPSKGLTFVQYSVTETGY